MNLIKNTLIRLFVVVIFLSGFHVSGYSFSIYTPPPLYVPIDSLSNEYLYYEVNLDFKEGIFVYKIEGKELSFKQNEDIQHYSTISIDTTFRRHNGYFFSRVASFDEKSEIHFRFNKLVSLTEDSIFVSAYYYKSSIEKGYGVGGGRIRSVAISKKDLAGIQVLFYPFGRKTVQNQLIAGYGITPGCKENTTSHAVELGWTRITSHYQHLYTSSYYLSNEFAFNRNAFFIGPKVGAQISFFMFGFGCEFVYYTDFHDNSLQWVPFFYWGVGNYKLHFDKRVPIYNKGFQNMNDFTIGFSMPIIPLSKKKIKL